jgi:hypothetical protein
VLTPRGQRGPLPVRGPSSHLARASGSRRAGVSLRMLASDRLREPRWPCPAQSRAEVAQVIIALRHTAFHEQCSVERRNRICGGRGYYTQGDSI